MRQGLIEPHLERNHRVASRVLALSHCEKWPRKSPSVLESRRTGALRPYVKNYISIKRRGRLIS